MQNKNKTYKILVIDDEEPIREILSASLQDESYQVEVARDGRSGLNAILKFQPHIVLLDIWMPGELDGIQVLEEALKMNLSCEFIVMSGHGTIETAVRATKLGAWDFLEKPLSFDKVKILLGNALSYQEEKAQKISLLAKLRQNIALIGHSNWLSGLKEQIANLSPKVNAVFIHGENGVGKKLLAQNIHYFSHRAAYPFVDINCANIPEELMIAEIFGADKSAFVGSKEHKKSKIELAKGGSLLLAEVDRLSLECQQKLVELIDTQTYKSLGSDEVQSANIRIIATCSVDLNQKLIDKQFSEDLYKRLSTISLYVPALRERKDDILVLAEHFAGLVAKESGFSKKYFLSDAVSKLQSYSWPANVRELKNFVERIHILIDDEEISSEELKYAGMSFKQEEEVFESTSSNSLKEARSYFEKEFILKKLEENEGNISKTAELIGVERSHLHRKIKSYGIDVKEKN